MSNSSMAKPDDWNSSTYSSTVAPFVPLLTTRITTLLSPQPTDTILDLGCGDGVLTKNLAPHVAKIVGVDASPAMIQGAKNGYAAENVEYYVWDGADVAGFLESRKNEAEGGVQKFDKVFSNAAMHWIMCGSPSRREACIRGIYDALVPGGVFVSESGGHLNCGDIRAALFAALMSRGVPLEEIVAASPWWFPTKKEMEAELVKVGFKAELVEEEFRPTEFTKKEGGGVAGWVRLFCAPFLRIIEEGKREEVVNDVARVIEAVGAHNDEENGVKCGYVRIRVVARKP